jgi:hypothetical protein
LVKQAIEAGFAKERTTMGFASMMVDVAPTVEDPNPEKAPSVFIWNVLQSVK